MKTVNCSNPRCADRRINWDNQYGPAVHRTVQVSDDFDSTRELAYCGLACKAAHALVIGAGKAQTYSVLRVPVDGSASSVVADGLPKLLAEDRAADLLLQDKVAGRGGYKYVAQADTTSGA